MEVFRFFHIMVLSTIFLQLLTFESAIAFKDFMADPDSSSNLETNEEEPRGGRRRPVDSKDSWLQFIRRGSRPAKQTTKKRKNKRLQRLGCPAGPAGPQGPPGPPGPKGAKVTIQELMTEFLDIVKEAAEKQAEKLISEKCGMCTMNNGSAEVSMLTNDVMALPRITSGFHLRLKKNVIVDSKTFIELHSFHQPFAAGSFQRGNAFNIRNGRFTAPKAGIYQFSVNLHVRVKRKGRRAKLKRKDAVKAQICINSLCNKYVSLSHVRGMESNSKIFTVSFSGFVQLQQSQYVSVYIDNSSKMSVVIQKNSDFTGIIMGT
ncbi:adipolin-like [Ostrea edulis]|uniref:adipolin-like n=1 Tax=Ostrea edulis TaxID=37623 RepID=UPI0024AECBB2|nr:adipolin-like [Ostrea edulis]